uniref:Uncharacterized protein n=1 Tax=Phasianus colchicus TaxID=9054 RepID=A0A669PBE3_PHACC
IHLRKVSHPTKRPGVKRKSLIYRKTKSLSNIQCQYLWQNFLLTNVAFPLLTRILRRDDRPLLCILALNSCCYDIKIDRRVLGSSRIVYL